MPGQRLFVVADGMGGHNAGDVASKLTTTSMRNYFEASAEAGFSYPSDEYAALDGPARRLAAGIRKANHDVFTISTTHQQHHGMGSTVVAVHLGEDGIIHVGHVGDSRCYRVRAGAIERLTKDHSLINDALELKPDLLPEELARLPKNIITRALGMKDLVKVDIRSEPTEPGDVYILCSDGLTGMVTDAQMLEVLEFTGDPAEACELLVAEANDAGGTDNISALIIRIDAGDDGALEEAGFASREGPPSPADETPRTEQVTEPELPHGLGSAEAPPAPLEAAPAVEVLPRLAEGAEMDLDLKGPWGSRGVPVPLCRACQHELYPGNSFCVECGVRV